MGIRILLKENTQPNNLFERNIEKVKRVFPIYVYGDLNITPENA